MSILLLVFIGVITGTTTVLFGFGGGFVTVPVLLWVGASAGADAAVTAVATSAVVMAVNAAVATAATPPAILAELRGTSRLLGLLGLGGAFGAIAAANAPAALIMWGLVAYLAVTILDTVARSGFLRPRRMTANRSGSDADAQRFAIPATLGAPIGALASFLGVGGSVMTVPLLRRAGMPMMTAAALANPLTLCVSVPALAVFLLTPHAAGSGGVLTFGAVDVGAAALMLAGSIPVVVIWRRRPPRLPDRLHAWGYVGLLGLVLAAVLTRAV
ncbi:TSUP family transporter [Leucobacter sp. NPDC015123]|uniref:TSUP family transporter n=1 Tax=Leucobacter sp. NPDC015123 TaxID=3364129 RepID=UPI0036F47C28